MTSPQENLGLNIIEKFQGHVVTYWSLPLTHVWLNTLREQLYWPGLKTFMLSINTYWPIQHLWLNISLCFQAILVNSTEFSVTQYLFCHNYSAQQKILWLNNILYHIFINSTEIICDWNMYKCTSLPICSIEMQLYGYS